MTNLPQELKLTIRGLVKRPGFFALVVATLALGIGGNAAIFEVIDNIYYRALPFSTDRLFRLHVGQRLSSGTTGEVNIIGKYFAEMNEQTRLSEMIAMRSDNASLIGLSEPLRVSVVYASPGWPKVITVSPALGRYFTEAEEKAGSASRVAVISDDLWKSRFDSSSEAIGRSLTLEDVSYTIVGIFPAGFRFPYQADIWLPVTFSAADVNNDYAVFARLKPQVTRAQFEEEVGGITRNLQKAHSEFLADDRVTVTPARESLVRGQDETAMALLGVVAFLLLIACIDVAALLLARSLTRRAEYAMRTALGASTADHVRTSLLEGIVLSILGSVFGLAIARVCGHYLSALLPLPMRRELAMDQVSFNRHVFWYSLAITMVVALICGCVPLLQNRKFNLYETLKSSGKGAVTGAGRRVLESLVVGQTAFALLLLFGAGLMIENFYRPSSQPLGVDANKTLTLVCSLPRTRYLSEAERIALTHKILASVSSLPEVSHAGIITVNPVFLFTGTWSARIRREGWSETEGMVVNHRLITPDLFAALGIPVLKGRAFTNYDGPDSAPVAIVSRETAQKLWPGEDPIGKRLATVSRLSGPRWRTVVGVVGDVHDAGDYRETWYVPYAQAATTPAGDELHIMVRTEQDPTSLAQSASAAVWKVDPTLPLRNVSRLDRLYESALVSQQTGAVSVGIFSGVGLLLAAIGAFGSMMFAVNRRYHEIGVRLTLGARPRDVVNMVVSWGARLAIVGTLLGLVGCVVLNRVLAHLLESVGKIEPGICVATAGTIIAVLLLASWLPARRAASIDPIAALRQE